MITDAGSVCHRQSLIPGDGRLAAWQRETPSECALAWFLCARHGCMRHLGSVITRGVPVPHQEAFSHSDGGPRGPAPFRALPDHPDRRREGHRWNRFQGSAGRRLCRDRLRPCPISPWSRLCNGGTRRPAELRGRSRIVPSCRRHHRGQRRFPAGPSNLPGSAR